MTFDLAQRFVGDAARQAATADGDDQGLDSHERNPSHATRELAVSPGVIVTRVGCCVYEGAPGTFEGLASSFAPDAPEFPSYADDYRGPRARYWLTIHEGTVTRIDEAYHS